MDKPTVKPQPVPITAAILWSATHELHGHFIGWLKKQGYDPAKMGSKPRKQKASKYLRLIHAR